MRASSCLEYTGVQDARQEMARSEPVEAQYGVRERCSPHAAAMTAAIDDCLDAGTACLLSHSRRYSPARDDRPKDLLQLCVQRLSSYAFPSGPDRACQEDCDLFL